VAVAAFEDSVLAAIDVANIWARCATPWWRTVDLVWPNASSSATAARPISAVSPRRSTSTSTAPITWRDWWPLRSQRPRPREGGERGALVLTASIAGYEGQIGQTAYAAAKAGVVGLTLAAARDLSAAGIRVNTVAPGT
jgi:NAD(P)-dependent dehydrogenase (short-subunit alcohol dehydrogenase family)